MTLSDFILRVVSEDDVTYQDIVRRAEKKGFTITHSYISKLVSGVASNISVEKLRALAAGLNRPEEDVFAIARGGRTEEKIKNGAASMMFFKYSQLSDTDKEALGPLIRALDREIEERLLKQKR